MQILVCNRSIRYCVLWKLCYCTHVATRTCQQLTRHHLELFTCGYEHLRAKFKQLHDISGPYLAFAWGKFGLTGRMYRLDHSLATWVFVILLLIFTLTPTPICAHSCALPLTPAHSRTYWCTNFYRRMTKAATWVLWDAQHLAVYASTCKHLQAHACNTQEK